MASVMRVRICNFSQKYVKTLLRGTNNFKTKHKLCFHNSSLLYVVGQELKMPSLSPTMSEGTIVKWLKKEGDTVAPGDVLCDIQTDKAIMSFETEEEGILAKILVAEDTKDVKVGSLIALMVAEGEDWKSVEIPTASASGSSGSSSSSSSSSSDDESSSRNAKKPSTYLSFGPAVRYLLEQYSFSADKVTPSGNRNKLLKSDVLKYIETNKLKPVPVKPVPPPKQAASSSSQPAAAAAKPAVVKKAGKGFSDIEVSGMRRTIAKRLTESKTTIPHSYGNISCTVDKITAMRKQLKSEGIAVSVNDFIIKAVGAALQQCPEINTLWVNGKAVAAQAIDISVAVSTPTGLITPIVKDAASKGLEEISATVKELAGKAREGKLQLHEFQGGSFTISNLGMFGVNEFSAIINPPQCGILAIGGGQPSLDKDGKPITLMTVTLSYDRRAIDEFEAANFLNVVKEMLEEPALMLLGGQQSLMSKLGV